MLHGRWHLRRRSVRAGLESFLGEVGKCPGSETSTWGKPAGKLGIKLDYRKPYTPRHGGVVERFFETLDQRLVSTLEGKTFSHPKERGEYLSEKEACLTLEDLEKMIYIFIAELYQEGFHSGVGCTPNRKWEDGIQVAQPALPSNRDDLKLFLMKK